MIELEVLNMRHRDAIHLLPGHHEQARSKWKNLYGYGAGQPSSHATQNSEVHPTQGLEVVLNCGHSDVEQVGLADRVSAPIPNGTQRLRCF